MMDPNGAARESEAAPFYSACAGSSLAGGDEKIVFFKKDIILLSFYRNYKFDQLIKPSPGSVC